MGTDGVRQLMKTLQDTLLTQDISPAVPLVQTKDAAARLQIYTSAYRIRLVEAVRSDYPATAAALGEELFLRLATRYAAAHPSTSYNLDIYPHGFAPSLHNADVPTPVYEVARLEQAIAIAFSAPESTPLDVTVLQHPDTLAAQCFALRTGSSLLALQYPVHEWLTASRNSTPPLTALADMMPQASYVYIYRHLNEVQRKEITKQEYQLLSQFTAPVLLGTALENIFHQGQQDADNVTALLSSRFPGWLQQGFFQGQVQILAGQP